MNEQQYIYKLSKNNNPLQKLLFIEPFCLVLLFCSLQLSKKSTVQANSLLLAADAPLGTQTQNVDRFWAFSKISKGGRCALILRRLQGHWSIDKSHSCDSLLTAQTNINLDGREQKTIKRPFSWHFYSIASRLLTTAPAAVLSSSFPIW